MGTEKQAAEGTAGDVVTVALHGTLPSAFQELYRALHKTSIYPVGHPAIRGVVERAREQLNRALEGRSSLMIGVTGTQLLVDRTPLEGPTTLQALAEFLHALDVA